MNRKMLIAWLALALATPILAAGPARADIDLLAEPPVVQAVREGDHEGLRAHLIRGESPHGVGNDGRSALMIAVLAQSGSMVDSLLQFDASVIHADRIGNTALHYAAESGSTRIVRALVDHDAPVDAVNQQGMTPLMVAARNGNAGAVEALIAAGANIDRLDYTGRSALMWAQDARSRPVEQVLREAGAQ